MSVRGVLAVVGRLLVGTGMVLLLFVAYQLWATGLETRAAQNQLQSDFDQQLQEVEAADDTDGTSDASRAARALLANVTVGDPVGRLEIPAIDVDYIVSMGVDLETLRSGPGLFPTNPLPGQPGNTAIAGHRATFDAPFNRLDELVPGDEVVVTTVQGTFRYSVVGHPVIGPDGEEFNGEELGYYIVEPTAVEILNDRGDNRITLMGCHPRYGATQRIVVEATLAGPVAEATPVVTPVPDGGDELLAGERGSIGAAIAWSAAVLAVVALALMAARRWNRWLVYAVATPVGLVLLFFAFGAVSDLSPVAY